AQAVESTNRREAVVGTYLDTTTIARLLSLSPRGTSGERDGERGCKNRAIDHRISPLPVSPRSFVVGRGKYFRLTLMVAVARRCAPLLVNAPPNFPAGLSITNLK